MVYCYHPKITPMSIDLHQRMLVRVCLNVSGEYSWIGSDLRPNARQLNDLAGGHDERY